uniref:Synaptobrevin, longin-like domain protein n=1 Tax=Tanacetum cinerariifolium TaxID=118510 RepID=A0A6L2JVX7_TANCI|nr:hypothetical protein [Tanacetum cinerariifolium]
MQNELDYVSLCLELHFAGLERTEYLIIDGYANLVQHTDKKELAIPWKTTTGKELSNPLMASSFPKTTLPTKLNEFNSTMASAIICLATNQIFNFSRYILLSLVKNIEAGVPFFMFPKFVQLIIYHQLGDMTHHKDIFATPLLTKKVFANIKRVAEHNVPLPSPSHDPLPSGEDSLKLKKLMDLCTNLSNKVLDLESEVLDIKSTYKAKIEKLESRVERLEEENMEESSKQERKIIDIDVDVEINLEKVQAEAYNLDLDHQKKVLSMLDVNDEEPADTSITAAEATKVIDEVPKPRKRRGVIIQDPEETTTTVTVQPKVQAKDKGKAILIEEPKPLKRQVQIKLDEEVARQLEAELNEAQSRRNMIFYLKNMASYKMDYFKGISYNEIISIFKKHYNYNQAFINKVNEGIKVSKKEVRQEKEVEVESSKKEGGSLEQEVVNKQKIEQEIKELKKHLKIILDDDDDDVERFKKTEPKNYTDDFLLNTLKIMSEKPNIEANVWKDQKGKYGLAKVKSLKLFESCGVHYLTLSTTQIFLLVEKMYPLTHFTLEQMVNDVRLKVEDESEMSLEILRLVRRQLNEGCVPQ